MRDHLARFYHLLGALLLPRSFRREYGAEMGSAVEERLASAATRSSAAVGAVFLRELADLAATAAREWSSEVMAARRGRMSPDHLEYGRGKMMGGLLEDVRYGLRSLAHRPGFSATVILTLALGIGGNTAMYAIVDGVLLRSMPYDGADRLAWVWGTDPDAPGSSRGWVSYPDYKDLRDSQSSFQELTAFRAPSVTLTSSDAEPTSVRALSADAHFPAVYRVGLALGRWFTEEEDRVGGPPVAVLSHGLWRQRYGADPGVLGQHVEIDGVSHEIIGVMPPEFDAPQDARIFRPLAQDAGQDGRGMHRLFVVGRLAGDATVVRASEDVGAIAARLRDAYPDTNSDVAAFAEPLKEAYVGSARESLLTLMGAVALVLLVVCANVAGLFLARSAGRRTELAVRAALGAPRGRLVRQLLTEAGLLAAGGALVGIGLAYVGLDALLNLAPAVALPRAGSVTLDGRVLAVATAVGLGTALLFGLVPALRASAVDLRGSLIRGAGDTGAGGPGALRGGLVLVEVSLAMALVVGAGLLIRSVGRVRALDPGFQPRDLYAAPLSLPQARYPLKEWPRIAEFYRRVREQVEEVPGVESAALAYAHPQDAGWATSFWVVGSGPPPPPSQRPEARYRPVGPGYFRTAGIRIVQGRGIAETDDASAPPVAVVNQAFVRTYLPDRDPLGARIQKETWWDGAPDGEWQIVGVVEDARFMGAEGGTRPAIYYPHAQRPMSEMYVLFRTDRELAAAMPLVKEAIWRLDSDLPVQGVVSLDEALSGSTAARRFNTVVLALFAGLALVLAVVGIYGIVSSSVSRRTREVGIRISLGAGRQEVLGLVLRQGLSLALGGVLLGGVGALFLSRLAKSLLFGVSATDPGTYVAVGALLLLAALVATLIPARRATRVDPVTALRVE